MYCKLNVFFFSGSHLSYEQILDFALEFTKKEFKSVSVAKSLNINHSTIIQWYIYLYYSVVYQWYVEKNSKKPTSKVTLKANFVSITNVLFNLINVIKELKSSQLKKTISLPQGVRELLFGKPWIKYFHN